MCATYIINNKTISTVGELEAATDLLILSCLVEHAPLNYDPGPEQCLCFIDPLIVSMKLNKLVLCDLISMEYIFQDKNNV